MSSVGDFLRERRESLREQDRRYSVRKVAERVGVQPSYLSKVERGEVAPPSEETLVRLARELSVEPDLLLAMAGKVSSDLLEIIRARPTVVAELLRAVRGAPAKRINEISRQVRDV